MPRILRERKSERHATQRGTRWSQASATDRRHARQGTTTKPRGRKPPTPPTQPSRPRLDEANVPRTQPRSSPYTPQEKSLRDPKHRTERRGPRPHRAQRHAGAIDPGALWATSFSGRTAPTPPSPFGATGRAKGTSPKARTDSAAAARTATSTSAYLARGTRRETARAPPLRHAPRAIP